MARNQIKLEGLAFYDASLAFYEDSVKGEFIETDNAGIPHRVVISIHDHYGRNQKDLDATISLESARKLRDWLNTLPL